MELILNDEQRMVDQAARNFMKRESPVSRMRALRDDKESPGYDKAVFKQMAELGWGYILFPEDQGGMGLGMAEMVVVMEAIGTGLAPEPLLSSVLMAGQILSLGGNDALQSEWLESVILAEKVLAVAYQEKGGRFDLARIETTAKKTGDGYSLDGRKTQVLDGWGADAVIVPARTSTGLFDGDAVVGRDDGIGILMANAESRFLTECRVVFVVGPRPEPALLDKAAADSMDTFFDITVDGPR